MKLKDVADMETYLAERAYCPGEIYDTTGFFYQIYDPEEECELIAKSECGSGVCVAVRPKKLKGETKEHRLQLVVINVDTKENKVVDTVSFDATDNNIKGIKNNLEGNREGWFVDEYEKGSTERALKEVLSIADAIIID